SSGKCKPAQRTPARPVVERDLGCRVPRIYGPVTARNREGVAEEDRPEAGSRGRNIGGEGEGREISAGRQTHPPGADVSVDESAPGEPISEGLESLRRATGRGCSRGWLLSDRPRLSQRRRRCTRGQVVQFDRASCVAKTGRSRLSLSQEPC